METVLTGSVVQVSSPGGSPSAAPDGPAVSVATEHLGTDHLLHNLGKRAVSGSFVTAGAQGAKLVLNVSSAAILARLLTPREFGLVGMVLAITSLMGVFKELGLSTATVQREKITQEQVSNLFWLNVGLSGLVALAAVAIAPLVAWFYHDSRLIGIMWALSLLFVLTGSTVQHQALLTRQMRFRALGIIDVTSMLAGIIAGCTLAWYGFSYWALVGQQLCVATVSLILIWVTSRWRPGLPTRGSGVSAMVRFGAHLTVSDLIGRFSVNTDSILIGRFFGAEPLGLYSRASVLLARPLEQLLSPLSSVMVPVLSRLQSDPERYRRTYLRAFETLALVTLPFSAMCLALSEPLVLIILGPKWSGVVPLFGAFTLVAVSLPLTLTCAWLFTSQGRGHDQLHAYIWTASVTVCAYLVGLHWGPLGLILALAAASLLIRQPVMFHLAGRHGPVRGADLWKSFFLHLPCWGAVFATASLGRALVGGASPLVQLLVGGMVGVTAGTAVMLMFRRPRETAIYAWTVLAKAIAGRRSSAA